VDSALLTFIFIVYCREETVLYTDNSTSITFPDTQTGFSNSSQEKCPGILIDEAKFIVPVCNFFCLC